MSIKFSSKRISDLVFGAVAEYRARSVEFMFVVPYFEVTFVIGAV